MSTEGRVTVSDRMMAKFRHMAKCTFTRSPSQGPAGNPPRGVGASGYGRIGVDPAGGKAQPAVEVSHLPIGEQNLYLPTCSRTSEKKVRLGTNVTESSIVQGYRCLL
jgi:hypothetical protein